MAVACCAPLTAPALSDEEASATAEQAADDALGAVWSAAERERLASLMRRVRG